MTDLEKKIKLREYKRDWARANRKGLKRSKKYIVDKSENRKEKRRKYQREWLRRKRGCIIIDRKGIYKFKNNKIKRRASI